VGWNRIGDGRRNGQAGLEAYVVNREHDEDFELTEYIWRNFPYLLTDQEAVQLV
jgi:hypothetical protein